MIGIQWCVRRFLRPKIFDVRSYYSYKYSGQHSSSFKQNVCFFNTYPKYFNKKFNCNFNFRKNKRYVLFAGFLTWLGFKKEEEEDPMISVMKLGILSLQKEEYNKAENILHLALKLAQERQDMKAQRYIFDLLANVAFKKGDFPVAEKLFIQVTKELIASGTQPDDNSIVEISLKLASIYSQTNQIQKAEIGFKFCIDTQQKKITDININDSDSLSEYQKDTILLWAMSVDWYARYLLGSGKFKEAMENFKRALQVSEKVNGASHPQTLVLLNDIGTVHTLMKNYESAINVFKQAIERSNDTDDSSDIPSLYCNLGATYLQAGNVAKGEEACKTALKLAKNFNNAEALADAKECLAEVKELKS